MYICTCQNFDIIHLESERERVSERERERMRYGRLMEALCVLAKD